MKPVVGVIVPAFALMVALTGFGERGQPPRLTAGDLALLSETYHLQAQLGSRVWPQWTPQTPPILYNTPSWDFLIGHPTPPPDFERSGQTAFGDDVWYRPNTQDETVQAAYPVGDAWTVVISAPGEDYSPALWALKAAHEQFHVYQAELHAGRVVNPFVGPYAGENELSFPFPYHVPGLRSLMRLEAEALFRAVVDSGATGLDVRMADRLLGHTRTLEPRVFDDSLTLAYKQLTEWSEGVARYTERELAALAADTSVYQPSVAFSEAFPSARYDEVWGAAYSDMLNPIRFVGEGVQGRVQFYYLGMGKAYLLDRLDPTWKERYADATLDVALTE